MGNTEIFAGSDIDIIAIQRITWRKCDRMHDAIQTIPLLAQFVKYRVDMFVNADIAFDNDVGIALSCHFFDTALQLFILESKCQFCALAVHGLRDTPCDRSVARQAHNQDPFALHKTHCHLLMFLLLQ